MSEFLLSTGDLDFIAFYQVVSNQMSRSATCSVLFFQISYT